MIITTDQLLERLLKQGEAWLAKQGRHITRAEIQYVGP